MKPQFDRVVRVFRSLSILTASLWLIGSSLSAPGQSDIAEASRPPRPYPIPPPFEENDITFVAPWNGEVLGTGARRPTEEEWNRSELESVFLDRIPITPLGLERVNAHRRARGQAPVLAEYYDALEPGRGLEAGALTSATSEPSAGTTAGALPTSIDNSSLGFFPPIRSQGSLNSCAQFSAVYYTLTHMTAMARNWNAKSGGDSFRFSPKWTYNVVNGGQNSGSWHFEAYLIAQQHGLATWSEFPYDSNYRAWCLASDTWSTAIGRRADQAGKVLDIDQNTGLGQLKQLLVNGYVLNFATFINSWIWKTIGNDPSTLADDPTVGKPCVIAVNGTSGGHSMTIVGFNDAVWVDSNSNGVVDPGEKGALRVANSWGTSWNEGGFCWIAYQALATRNPARNLEGLAWYDEATWVTARVSHIPRLIAQFNITHAKRSQVTASLGVSNPDQTQPSVIWTTKKILSNAGGAYAFDGNALPIASTFALDFSDLAPMSAGTKRYYLRLSDSTTGDPLTVSSFALIDGIRGKTVVNSDFPRQADGILIAPFIDYDVVAGGVPPVIVVSASTTSGPFPLVVEFDASASNDPDGTIASAVWDFGDGTSANGLLAQRVYSTPGVYVATIDVADNEGFESSRSITIEVVDPNVISAPTQLAGSSYGRVVTLTWSDSSANETGFAIERALKPKTGTPVYSVVGTTGPNMTSFAESVAAGTYLYRVQAISSVTGSTSAYTPAFTLRVR